MSYQIPQQLEYNEKIIFGLTFKQLIYAFGFGVLALFILKKVPEPYNIYFALIPSIAGVCFIVLDLETRIKILIEFIRNRSLKEGDHRLDTFVGVKEIKKDYFITDKEKKISILKIQPINFSIKPKAEQDAIMASFQKFLNALDFPIQILMHTEGIKLDSYLNSLESRIKNERFAELFEKYKKFLIKIINNKKIMNRVFYLVIPEQENLEIQTDICIERLNSLGLRVKRLRKKELKLLLKKFFLGKYTKNGIIPKPIINKKDHLETGKRLYRVIYAHGYPRMVEPGFLDRIVSSSGDFNLSIHIKPHQIESMLVDVNRGLQKQRADLFSMNSKGIINPSLEIQYKDTRSILENLQKGKEKLFDISLYINCKADNEKELNFLTKKVEAELNSIMIVPKVADYRMLRGFKSTAPLGVDLINENRNITTSGLSAFFPFTSQFLEVDDTGIWLGLNKNKIPIIKDIFKLPNPNGLILAQSGGGKSYFSKLLITRYLLNGTKVMVIDPQGEYRNIVNSFGGQRIDLSRTSDTIINPLDLMGHDYTEKRLSLMDLMKVMLGDLSEPQKGFIDRAINEAYEKKGINEEPHTWDNKPPILSDVLFELERMEKKAIQLEKSTIRSLVNRLRMYTTGVFKFLNKQTSINFDNKFVCFDIGDLPKQVKPTVMFLVLDYVYMKMKKDLSRKILLIDEAWTLLSRSEDASYIFEIVKTCRKFNMGLLLINQEVEGLLTSDAGKSVLANSSYTLLMRQKPAVIDNICKTFHLSNSERTHLLTANVGEGLLIMEDDHSQIKVVASPEENELITTNADEILNKPNKIPEKIKPVIIRKQIKKDLKKKVVKNKPKKKIKKETKKKKPIKKKLKTKIAKKKEKNIVNITLDPDKAFFKYKGLKEEEINYLLRKGYIISRHRSIDGDKKEKYLLKPRSNESPSHFFYSYDIADYLRKYTDKIELFTTTKPDVVFEINGKKIGVEVETGKSLKHAKKKVLEKVALLNKNYDDWFFVVLDRKSIAKYRKLGKVLDLRSFTNHMDRFINKLRNLSEHDIYTSKP